MTPSEMTDEGLLTILRAWMNHDTRDLNRDIHAIKKNWPKDFWDVWGEIKSRKLDWKMPDELHVGIIGTRARDSYDDYQTIYNYFNLFVRKHKIVIVSGLCTRGGDKFATILYKTFGTRKLWFPAQWDKYGRRKAGFIRNTDIAMVSDKLIAMVRTDRKGGTEDTIIKFCTIQGNTNNLKLL